MSEDQDIKDVIRTEQSRGKKQPLSMLALKEERLLREMLKEILRPETTEDDFRDFMRALGHEPDSETFRRALPVWRALQRS